MDPKVLNCRNFKCSSNKKGICSSPRIELVPVGGLIDRLICVQATEPLPGEAKQTPNTNPDQ